MLHMIKAAALAGMLSLAPLSAIAADKYVPPPVAAVAEEPPSFLSAPSCYVQGMAGSQITAVKNNVLPASLSASGWSLTLGAGCDVRLNRFVVGGVVRASIPVDTDARLLIDSDYSYLAAMRAGYLLNSGLLAYGIVGFQGNEFGSNLLSIRDHGLALGGGLEVKLTDHTSITAEYLQVGYGRTKDLGVNIEPVEHNFRLGLSYRFGGLFQ